MAVASSSRRATMPALPSLATSAIVPLSGDCISSASESRHTMPAVSGAITPCNRFALYTQPRTPKKPTRNTTADSTSDATTFFHRAPFRSRARPAQLNASAVCSAKRPGVGVIVQWSGSYFLALLFFVAMAVLIAVFSSLIDYRPRTHG